MIRKMSEYIKGYTVKLILGPALKLAEAVFELFVPLIVASIIDNGIKPGDTAHIWRMGLVLLLLGVTGLIFSITAQYFAAAASVGFAGRLREKAFARVMGMTQSQTAALGESTLIARLTSDIDSVQNGFNLTLRLLLRSPFVVFGAMIMAFTVDFKAAWAFAVAIPALALCVFGVMAWSSPLMTRARESADKATGLARENITGARVIRAFGRENDENARFSAVSADLNINRARAWSVSALTNPLTSTVINASLIVLIYTGALRVEVGGITQGELVALVNYMSQISIELIKLANLTMSVSRAVSCFKRVQAVAETPNGAPISEAPVSKSNAAVEFENVSLTYENAGAPALQNISFTVLQGQTVGIVGPTGSGKSSLVNLIPRFYDATEGTVCVFGKNVKSVSVVDLRSRIAVVPQKAILFRGTISENIRNGRFDASDGVVMKALSDGQGADIVKSKRNGMNAEVGAFGRALSGGQRQRVSIARALVKRADILILDDSSSALDFVTDSRLRAAISQKRDMTVFIVSQRASGVKSADMILVMDEGKLTAIGTHAELMQTSELYKEIYESQFPEGDEYAI